MRTTYLFPERPEEPGNNNELLFFEAGKLVCADYVPTAWLGSDQACVDGRSTETSWEELPTSRTVGSESEWLPDLSEQIISTESEYDPEWRRRSIREADLSGWLIALGLPPETWSTETGTPHDDLLRRIARLLGEISWELDDDAHAVRFDDIDPGEDFQL